MLEQHRIATVREMLSDFVRSPSLKHLRSVHVLDKLASEIVRRLDLPPQLWSKWGGSREDLIRMACPCWIPVVELAAALNELPGPKLTLTDVSARLQVVQEELGEWSIDRWQAGCEAIFNDEKRAGTELMAIAVRIRTFIEDEEARLHRERDHAYRERVAAKKASLEARFLAGADCKWTPIAGSKDIFCRMNGRVFRLSRAVDGRYELERISSHESGNGIVAGRYARRGDATAAVREMAYKPDFLT